MNFPHINMPSPQRLWRHAVSRSCFVTVILHLSASKAEVISGVGEVERLRDIRDVSHVTPRVGCV